VNSPLTQWRLLRAEKGVRGLDQAQLRLSCSRSDGLDVHWRARMGAAAEDGHGAFHRHLWLRGPGDTFFEVYKQAWMDPFGEVGTLHHRPLQTIKRRPRLFVHL
jgi:hypothetical protein